MKKTKLIVDFEYEFDLIGISSSIKFYKLAWAINNKLNIHLVRQKDYIMESKKTATNQYGLYTFTDESGEISFYKNRSLDSESTHLLPEMTHFDYIMKLSGWSQSFAKEEIINELKDVKWIEYIAALDVSTLKSKENFLS